MKLSQKKIDKINEASLIAFVVSLLLFLALRIFRNNFAAPNEKSSINNFR